MGPTQWTGIIQIHCSEMRLGMILGIRDACRENVSGGKYESNRRKKQAER